MNRKTMIGIAAGAVALAGVAAYFAKRRNDRKNFEANAAQAKDHFKGKLNELQRKAGKELKNAAAETKEAVNSAKERANEWVNSAAKA
ncbi:hypothetical protein [Flavobacterium alkalisoli]|uniref:hypothetical protein n=1 Tax=Flavobacterium alkalisoli TaxID=2602769 RepID=UPI003A93552A